MSEQHRFTNREIADLLAGVAARLQILDANRFRVIAYQNAAENIRNMAQDINNVAKAGGLDDIPGVGKGIAEALQKVLDEGHIAEFDDLLAQVPQGVVEMMEVPDMGPKKAKRLWEELGIDSVEALKIAAEEGKLRLVHVLVVRHRKHFRIRQLLRGFFLPVAAQFGVFFDQSRHDTLFFGGSHCFAHCGFGVGRTAGGFFLNSRCHGRLLQINATQPINYLKGLALRIFSEAVLQVSGVSALASGRGWVARRKICNATDRPIWGMSAAR